MGDLIDTVQIAARVPKKDRDALEEIAKENDRTASAEIRIALRAHIESQTKRTAA